MHIKLLDQRLITSSEILWQFLIFHTLYCLAEGLLLSSSLVDCFSDFIRYIWWVWLNSSNSSFKEINQKLCYHCNIIKLPGHIVISLSPNIRFRFRWSSWPSPNLVTWRHVFLFFLYFYISVNNCEIVYQVVFDLHNCISLFRRLEGCAVRDSWHGCICKPPGKLESLAKSLSN